MSGHFFGGSYCKTADSLVSIYALKAYKKLADPETGRDGVSAGGPLTDTQLDALCELLERLNCLEELITRSKDAPELRRKFQAMANQVEAQIVSDAWGPAITQIANVVSGEVIQS